MFYEMCAKMSSFHSRCFILVCLAHVPAFSESDIIAKDVSTCVLMSLSIYLINI
jgi:hypothetical protein